MKCAVSPLEWNVLSDRFHNLHLNGSSRADQFGGSAMDAPFSFDYVHRIRFTRDVFNPANPVLRDVLGARREGAARAVVFVDDGVANAWSNLIPDVGGYAGAHASVLSIAADVQVVPGGERAKNDWSIYETVARAISDSGICRHSYVFAIGGGAVLDAVGFAASTVHRGVRLIRFPTTTLSQDDGGLGVKNGINAFGKKNFLGAFDVPWAVINDERFLATLSDRDWRAGLSEAVKVALLKDAAFFDLIAQAAPRLRQRDQNVILPIIQRSAELHVRHITENGDPFEQLTGRPLDFGHWSAHKLEQMTHFRIRHGEAVAIGIAIDSIYSQLVGLIDESDVQRILGCLADLGFTLYDDALANHAALLDGLREFREHLGGELTITLLRGIGRPVDVHAMDADSMVRAIERLAAESEALHAAP